VLVCYLKKDGASLYKVEDNKITKMYQEPLSLTKFLQKKVLVISKELLYYTRRSYPSVPLRKLRDALRLEVEDLFPVSNVNYTFRVFEASEKSTIVDIWAWSKEEEERARKLLSFQFIIPEDLLFLSEGSAIIAYKQEEVVHLVAVHNSRFLGSLSMPNLTGRDVELFLAGLMPFSQEIKKFIIYGEILKDLTLDKAMVRLPEKPYPISLEGLQKINLSDFKVKRSFTPQVDLVLRLPIYALIGYSIFLYVKKQSFEQSTKELKAEIAKLDKALAHLENKTVVTQDYSALLNSLNNKTADALSVITVMNELANYLPVGCSLKRFNFKENKVELSLTFDDPIEVIELLERSKLIKSVKLDGPPYKKTNTKLYDFRLTLELKPYD